jgi:hypothetical protein
LNFEKEPPGSLRTGLFIKRDPGVANILGGTTLPPGFIERKSNYSSFERGYQCVKALFR